MRKPTEEEKEKIIEQMKVASYGTELDVPADVDMADVMEFFEKRKVQDILVRYSVGDAVDYMGQTVWVTQLNKQSFIDRDVEGVKGKVRETVIRAGLMIGWWSDGKICHDWLDWAECKAITRVTSSSCRDMGESAGANHGDY